MTRIGLLSDTHGYLDPSLREYFEECDELWHAGDVGGTHVIEELKTWKNTVRGVYGNIDGHEIRIEWPEDLRFELEGFNVFMTHIAGYPGRYNRRVREIIGSERPGIVVCGHSHILKIIYDKKHEHLHINPGAAGKQGFQKVRTAVRFTLDEGDVRNMQVVELGGD